MLWIVLKLPFITEPFIFDWSKIPKIEGLAEFFGFIIENLTISAETTLQPKSLICQRSIRIVKLSITLHGIIFPLSFVIPPVMKLKLTVSFLKPSLTFVTRVNGAFLIDLIFNKQ